MIPTPSAIKKKESADEHLAQREKSRAENRVGENRRGKKKGRKERNPSPPWAEKRAQDSTWPCTCCLAEAEEKMRPSRHMEGTPQKSAKEKQLHWKRGQGGIEKPGFSKKDARSGKKRGP